MGETRIELRHLLVDIRDSYPCPEEEIIVTELVANGLDSGATGLDFRIDFAQRQLTVTDNGRGMVARSFKSYHDIAATTKIRGKGIGFAGVGAKIALLVAESVVTETKRGKYHRGTRWKLETPRRAPWRFIAPTGRITGESGTAVTITLNDPASPLLKEDYIERIIREHFLTLLSPHTGEIMKVIYPRGVSFSVNGRLLTPSDPAPMTIRKTLWIRTPGVRKFAGYGYLGRTESPLPDRFAGVAISALGKTIKRGWEWLGLTPRDPARLTGLVEVPQLVEILTTSKSDFLKDSTSLRKYYRLRKAIQAAVEPVLREFGELGHRHSAVQAPETLGRQFDRVIGRMLAEFPELSPLLGRRLVPSAEGQASRSGESTPDEGESPTASIYPDIPPSLTDTLAPDKDKIKAGIPAKFPPDSGSSASRTRQPAMRIGFEDTAADAPPARMEENSVFINRGHPAFVRAEKEGAREYHIAFCLAWVLSSYLDSEKSPRDFISAFLSRWGQGI